MAKENKDEKIQVLLSCSDHHKLKNIILNYSMLNGRLMTSSAYVRALILSHIREYEGELEIEENCKNILMKNAQ